MTPPPIWIIGVLETFVIFLMRCQNPQLIINRYTHVPMYVDCRKCDACRINYALQKSTLLGIDMLKSKFNLFVTFTYDNWNIPFVIDGLPYVFRLADDGTPFVVETLTFDVFVDGCLPIRHFPLAIADKCVGIIYYRDFQLFLKRLRKQIFNHYGKYREIKMFVAGEYGTISQRPHFHAIFGFEDSEFKSFVQGILYQCWRMCDRFRFESYIQHAESGCSSYVASYVNSGFSGLPFLLKERFKPCTHRSKSPGFGSYLDDVSQVESFIKRYYGKEVFQFDRRDFIRVENPKTRDRSVSFRLIPLSVFNRYFTQIKGFGRISFVDFCLLCYRVYEEFGKQRKYGRTDFNVDLLPFMPFLRSYRRYLVLLDLIDNFYNFSYYVTFSYRAIVFYKSCLLYLQMVEFEDTSSPLDYLYRQYNTFSHHLTKLNLTNIYRSLNLDFVPISGFYCKNDEFNNKEFLRKYRSKLLPKHLNDLNYKL